MAFSYHVSEVNPDLTPAESRTPHHDLRALVEWSASPGTVVGEGFIHFRPFTGVRKKATDRETIRFLFRQYRAAPLSLWPERKQHSNLLRLARHQGRPFFFIRCFRRVRSADCISQNGMFVFLERMSGQCGRPPTTFRDCGNLHRSNHSAAADSQSSIPLRHHRPSGCPTACRAGCRSQL